MCSNHHVQYADGLKAKEQEERDARLSKLRPSLRNMLKGNPNVFHYTTFATADKVFAQHPIWQQAKIEAERKLVFDEYVAELKQREVVRGCFDLMTHGATLLNTLAFKARKPRCPLTQHLQDCRVIQASRRGRTHEVAASTPYGGRFRRVEG